MLSAIKSGIGWFVVHLEFQDGCHINIHKLWIYKMIFCMSMTEWLKWWLCIMFVMPKESKHNYIA